MKNPSFVLNKPFNTEIQDRPIPMIDDPRSVKIEVKKTGICGSDIHFYTHGSLGSMSVKVPMVLGHESSGIIVEVGEQVTQLKVGDKVAMEPGIPSRYSKEYKSGHYNLCPDMKFAATPPVDGTLCKYYVLPEDFCVKLPNNVSLEEGALVEPLAVAVHAARLAHLSPGSRVAIFGAGPIGLLITAVAIAFGALEVTTVDLVESRLKLATNMGATATVQAYTANSAEKTATRVISANGEKRPNVVFDASGAEVSIKAGIFALESGGTFVQVGMGNPETVIPMSEVIFREINLKGAFRYCTDDYSIAVDLISKGRVDVTRLITHVVDFENSRDAYELVRNGEAVKCIINGP